ncbi:MAG: hypothetical protein COW04_02850 [Deltaproteobacteria bacterium CG12_big_fil_rev_8_21_14_0_65_43_10]|nr:MAG: hypothetical protein AUK23_13120 [Deltaproteobacteria bacterium CG2_30_43_15]PIQ46304.1 MAG: hypothetical protein COW04_02850 [Deltaproteobacteria bacterium CG12_big_fil_rev_8_21_14_0_65_43_10]PIU84546.1 MAG: hypothetical protein COS67_12605 [Deltaproteobacteria bacterium CG06_land_8_20_14_3_00_44_19]PIX22970.1 MAG: hypothetical protein COZ68_10695 [Deltaproteobacteria bacterium CG_4_8_14_3_um_filter_43_13]PIZ19114.1 MAG: hypothetical protein COY50_11810 [Deltaproteobacteria bacterium C
MVQVDSTCAPQLPCFYHIFFGESRKTRGLKLGSSDSTRERGKECNFCGDFGKLIGHLQHLLIYYI